MDAQTSHLKVGRFDCLAVIDGLAAYTNPARILFTGAPEESVTQVLNEHIIPALLLLNSTVINLLKQNRRSKPNRIRNVSA